jgi:hypothetical protein
MTFSLYIKLLSLSINKGFINQYIIERLNNNQNDKNKNKYEL